MDPNQASNKTNQDLMISPDDTLMTLEKTPNPEPMVQTDQEVKYTPPLAWGTDQTEVQAITPLPQAPTETTPLPHSSVTPPPVEYPSSQHLLTHPSPKKTSTPLFLIGLVLVFIGILLGVLASFVIPAFSLPSVSTIIPSANITPTPTETITEGTEKIAPTAEVTPIPAPTATPSALLNLKWNLMTVKSPLNTFSSYQLYYPSSWSITTYKNTFKPDDAGSSTLVLTKGKVSINIRQEASISSTCLFPDDPIQEAPGFMRLWGFREISKVDASVWRWGMRSDIPSGSNSNSSVCEKQSDGKFISPTRLGDITVSGTVLDKAASDEINYILEKISVVDTAPKAQTTYQCPASGYVDCMPILDDAKKKACSQEAMVWYQANCPNFQGAAL